MGVMLYRERKLLKKILRMQDPVRGVIPAALHVGRTDDYLVMLLEAGLVKPAVSQTLANPSPRHDRVVATSAGRHYGEIQWAEVRRFMLRSVLVPIAVSAATTLLTILIHSMLG